jgi:hypothetical protein
VDLISLMHTRKNKSPVLGRLVMLAAVGFVFQTTHADPSGETTVFHVAGKGRVHVEKCRRLSKDPAELAKLAKMTLAEAKTNGLLLCSKCPGSTTVAGGFESWVKPGPKVIEKTAFVTNPLAPLISMGTDGKLVYKPYSDKGDRLMDWSHCGYKNSSVPIPDVPVAVTLDSLAGNPEPVASMAYPMGPDSHGRIQAAIDKVAAMEPDADGSRGAVLLKKGTYYVKGGLTVRSGVVLRGEGDGEDGTILIIQSAKGGDNAIHLGEPEAKTDPVGEEKAVRIMDEYLPSGSLELTVADAAEFQVGDDIHVVKTPNQAWIDHLGMGQRLQHIRGGKEGAGKRPWKPESYQFRHLRKITAINGQRITLNAILPQSFDQKHGGGLVDKVDVGSCGRHAGVETLQVVSNYDTSVKDTGKDANFMNFKNGVSIAGTQDSWVRNCTVKHVSFAAVGTGDDTKQITVRDVKNLAPVGPKRGGKRYAFNIGGGTLHLFYNCYSEDSRHDFALGSRETGPFAFVKCTALRGGQSEPHHRWSSGALYDNVSTKDGSLAAINRGDSGSGHGWAAANTMFWNCDAKSIVVMDPETEGENNFAIGYRGTFDPQTGADSLRYANDRAGSWGTPQEGKFYGHALMGSGYIESPDGPVKPDSLFEQQLIDRIGKAKAEKVLKSALNEDTPTTVLFEDSLTGDWQENWFLDGKKATLEHREGGLYFAGGTVTKADDPVEYNAHHAVLWTKQVFEGDIRISYQMKQVDTSGYGNTLLYIQAQGIGSPPYVEDIHEWRKLREVPDMSTYFTYMDLLSLSLRENIRCKRYPWRDEKLEWYPTQGLIEPMVDYPGVTPGGIYQVIVDKKGDSLRLRLYDESGAILHVDHTWDTREIAEGIEPRKIQKGRIGIRHMATKQSIYKNFKVEQL